ncbi:MAG: GldG family protein, partial [Proteobacteria bacterium]|nr:GldG family protein [Pseudomonadota bacterium]
MGATGKRRLNAYLQLIFAFIIFLSVNLFGNAWLGPIRFDLTGDKLFTLNPGTREILAGLEEPLTLRFYFSKGTAANDPALFRYGRRVQDFLEEFEVLSDGKIRLEVIDPEPFSEEREEAATYGVQGLGEGDQTIFLGLVGFDETNRLEVISLFSEERERFLEFDLAKIVFLLSQEKKPVVGLITSLPMRYGTGGARAFLQGKGQPYLIYTQLTQL